MMKTIYLNQRILTALRASAIHLGISIIVAAAAAVLVFTLWYPSPFGQLAGGRELFFLIVSVDVVCGPVLTAILFNPAKPRKEMVRDLSMVAIIQLAALVYGLWTVWLVRPLYLVHEVDRFKVISAAMVDSKDLSSLARPLQVGIFSGPLTVGIRPARDVAEKNAVMFESANGGKDYGERPNFYIPYDQVSALKAVGRSRELTKFLKNYPEEVSGAEKIASSAGLEIVQLRYLPVIGRQQWIAVMSTTGDVLGYLKGDGF